MKKHFSFFLFFIQIIAFAQLNPNLNKYYNLVNIAEINITNNKIYEAYSNYKMAFKIRETPFEIDQYNFAVCCAILNKKHKSFKHIKFLIEYGYPADSLINNKELKYLKKQKWQNKINEISIKYNIQLKNKLDSLLNQDQKFRIKDKHKYKDIIFKIDSTNAITLINKKDFFCCFSETKIGVDLTPIRIIVMHNFQNLTFGKDLNSLYDLLNSCVYSGEIDVRKAAYYLQGYNVENYGSSFRGISRYGYLYTEDGITKKSELSKPGIPNFQITNEININRMKIGLCPIEDYIKKIKFNYFNKSFRLINSADISNIYFADEENYEKALEKLIFLD